MLRAAALQLDDREFVTENPLVTRPGWPSTARFFQEVLNPSTVDCYYLPLSMTSLMADYAMGGRDDDLRVFHVTSLALHVLTAVLLFWMLGELFGNLAAAALAALLFGLHPLTVEPIAWVAERKTLLATCFAFASMLTYIQHVRRGGAGRMVATLLLYLLAILSKPTVAMLPVLLLLLDVWPLARFGRKAVVEKWPFYLLMVASGIVTYISHQRSGAIAATDVVHLPLRAAYVLGFYLHKMIWPGQMSSVYPLPEPLSLANPAVLVSLIGVSLLTLFVALLYRRSRGPLVAWLFFLIALAPTLGLVQYSWVIASDKYLYFAAAGIVLLIGAGLTAAWRSASGRGAVATGALLLAMLPVLAAEGWGVRGALRYWSDSLTLWRHAVSVAPRSAEAHNGLGVALQMRFANAEAIQEYRRAVELDPSHFDRQLNLGILLSRSGQHDEAIQHLRRACELTRSPNAPLQLGIALARAGRPEEAEALLRRGLALRPLDLEALIMLGLLRVVRGHPDEGITILRGALARAPEDPRPPYNLAVALIRVPGHHPEVVDLLRQAIQRKPDWPAPRRVLAWLLATNPAPALRDPAEALRLADSAVELTGGHDASALDAQAAARAALGQFTQAAESARLALALAPSDSSDPVHMGIRKRLALYERQIAYTEPAQSDSSLTLR